MVDTSIVQWYLKPPEASDKTSLRPPNPGLILENALVRAAAVDALSKIAMQPGGTAERRNGKRAGFVIYVMSSPCGMLRETWRYDG